MPQPARRRLPRLLGALGRALLLVSCFAAALLASIALHIGVPSVRNSVGAIANVALRDVLYGKIEIGRIERLGWNGLSLERAQLLDPEARRVIVVEGLRVNVALIPLLYQIIRGGSHLNIELPHVRIERGQVGLYDAGAAKVDTETLSIETSVRPRPSQRPAGTRAGPSRHVRVHLPQFEVGTVRGVFGLEGWEELEPVLRRVRGGVLFSPQGIVLDIDHFGAHSKNVFGRRVRGAGTFALRSPGPMRLDFSGFADGAEVQASLGYDADQLTLHAILPRVRPETLRSWLGSWPGETPLSVELQANGAPPRLDATATIDVGEGTVTARGPLDLSEGLSAQVDLAARGIQLQDVVSAAPQVAIDIDGQMDLKLSSGDYEVGLVGSSKETTLDDVLVPPLLFDLQLGPSGLDGKVELLEPGARSVVRGSITDDGIDATVDIAKLSLSNRRLPRGLGGVSSLKAAVKIKDERFRVDASGAVDHLRVQQLEVGHAHFDIEAKGALARPEDAQLEVDARAQQLRFGDLRFDEAKLQANGNRLGAKVNAALSATGGRRVTFAGHVASSGVVTDARASFEKPDLSASAEVRRFDWDRQHFDVPRLSIRGSKGRLEARLTYQPGVAEGAVSARDLQLRKVAQELGLGTLPLRGTLSLDSEFSVGSDLQRGQLHASFEDLAVQEWGNTDVSFSARLDEGSFSGSIGGKDELGFSIEGNWDTQLGGHALDPVAYERLTGTAQIAVAGVPLGPLAYVLPSDLVKGIDGKLGVRALLRRTTGEGYPNALVEVGCAVDRAVLELGQTPYELSTIGSYLSLAFEAESRAVSATATLSDANGLLLTAQARTRVDPDDWRNSPERGLTELERADLLAQFTLPDRPIAQLPLLEDQKLAGSLSAQVGVSGTLLDSRIQLLADVRNLTPPGVRADNPIDLHVEGALTPADGQVNVGFSGQTRGRRLLTGVIQGTVPWDDTPQSGAPLFATATFDRLPLSLLDATNELQVGGELNGQLLLRRGDAPVLTADLELDRLSSGRAVLGSGLLQLRGSPGTVLANFATTKGDRSLTVRLSATGSTNQVPLPNQFEQVDVAILAEHLDAAALGPALESIVARLGGHLDADLTVSAKRRTSTEPGVPHTWSTHIDGKAELLDGIGYIEGVGMELRSVELELRAEQKGQGSVLTIAPLRAKVRSDEVNLEGQAELVFDGLELVGGTGALRLRSVPLTLQGHNIGKARGQALARLERRPEWDVRDRWYKTPYLYVEVDLKDWQLVAAPSVSRDLIDPNPNPDIVIVQSDPEEPDGSTTMPYRVVIHLDNRTRFSLSDLQVPLRGTVVVDYTDQPSMRGRIQLERGGRIPIFGRVFRVVEGQLQLNPKDASNPLIDITLSGRDSNDEPVLVTISGTLQEPTTQPSPAELQALLGGGAASVLGSGVSALGINQLLGNTVQLNVSSTTEDENEASYGASVQLDENLWFEANYERNQDATVNQEASSVISGTLDYRFRNNWSLRTRVGNTGGSVDVLWEYRY